MVADKLAEKIISQADFEKNFQILRSGNFDAESIERISLSQKRKSALLDKQKEALKVQAENYNKWSKAV